MPDTTTTATEALASELLTLEEAAKALRISVATMHRLLAKPKDPIQTVVRVRVGRRIMFNRESLLAFMRGE